MSNPAVPITTNQIVEVGIHKPKCATFCGNTLNDHLKWIEEQLCEIDWSEFNIQCLGTSSCEQTQKVVIQAMIDKLCELSSCDCTTNQNTQTVYNLTVQPEWEAITANPTKALKSGKLVNLMGSFVRNTDVNAPVIYLPLELRPKQTLRFPIAYNHIGGPYNQIVEIQPGGVLKVIYIDLDIDQDSNFHLNGITYFID